MEWIAIGIIIGLQIVSILKQNKLLKYAKNAHVLAMDTNKQIKEAIKRFDFDSLITRW
jgi:hypothetical protein